MPTLLLHNIIRALADQRFLNVHVITMPINTLGVTRAMLPLHQLLVEKVLLHVKKSSLISWLLNAALTLDVTQVSFLLSSF